ncbi:MAG: hypothetical protein PHQ34_11550 [Methanothrix sp.]|nr:hypothetical protein [Methanothrix sp.]
MNQLVLFYRIDKAIVDLAADILSRYGLFISDVSYLSACSLPIAGTRARAGACPGAAGHPQATNGRGGLVGAVGRSPGEGSPLGT